MYCGDRITRSAVSLPSPAAPPPKTGGGGGSGGGTSDDDIVFERQCAARSFLLFRFLLFFFSAMPEGESERAREHESEEVRACDSEATPFFPRRRKEFFLFRFPFFVDVDDKKKRKQKSVFFCFRSQCQFSEHEFIRYRSRRKALSPNARSPRRDPRRRALCAPKASKQQTEA